LGRHTFLQGGGSGGDHSSFHVIIVFFPWGRQGAISDFDCP